MAGKKIIELKKQKKYIERLNYFTDKVTSNTKDLHLKKYFESYMDAFIEINIDSNNLYDIVERLEDLKSLFDYFEIKNKSLKKFTYLIFLLFSEYESTKLQKMNMTDFYDFSILTFSHLPTIDHLPYYFKLFFDENINKQIRNNKLNRKQVMENIFKEISCDEDLDFLIVSLEKYRPNKKNILGEELQTIISLCNEIFTDIYGSYIFENAFAEDELVPMQEFDLIENKGKFRDCISLIEQYKISYRDKLKMFLLLCDFFTSYSDNIPLLSVENIIDEVEELKKDNEKIRKEFKL